MKLYQIIMKVPDNFVPEDMELIANCSETVEVCSEGFIGPASFTEVEAEFPDFVGGELEQENRTVAENFDADSYYGEVSDFDTEDTEEPVIKEDDMLFEEEDADEAVQYD